MLLHCEETNPAMATPADKEKIENRLSSHAEKGSIHYEKGNFAATSAIAAKRGMNSIDGQIGGHHDGKYE